MLILETEVKTNPKNRTEKQNEAKTKAGLQFFFDSSEQISTSIDGMELRDKLYQAVQAAIARGNKNSSAQSTTDETENVDSTNEAPLKTEKP